MISRQQPHPSGPFKPVTVSLSPHHLDILDHVAADKNLSRSAALAHILDRIKK